MKPRQRLAPNEHGAATVEMAFALPVFIVMLWMLVELGFVYQAVAGMQQGLGEGARYATLCIPANTGCSSHTATEIQSQIQNRVFGVGLGTFTVPLPTKQTSGSSSYYDLTVEYSQPTSLILLPGPTIDLTRSKRVWIPG